MPLSAFFLFLIKQIEKSVSLEVVPTSESTSNIHSFHTHQVFYKKTIHMQNIE